MCLRNEVLFHDDAEGGNRQGLVHFDGEFRQGAVRPEPRLALIAETQPGSLAELAALSGRAKSNLSRTLKTMERYGLVQLRNGQGGTVAPRNRIRGSRWPSLWSHGGNDSQTTPKALSFRVPDLSGESLPVTWVG